MCGHGALFPPKVTACFAKWKPQTYACKKDTISVLISLVIK